MIQKKKIYCCGCGGVVDARLTTGKEIYPHRRDLYHLPFWKCDVCFNFVGCHHKTDKPTRPLGIIPTPEIKNARKHIHALLDPLWQSGRIRRAKIYAMLSEFIGKPYHTGEIDSVETAREIYREIMRIKKSLQRDAHVS